MKKKKLYSRYQAVISYMMLDLFYFFPAILFGHLLPNLKIYYNIVDIRPSEYHFFSDQSKCSSSNDCKGICSCCYYQLISKNMQLILVCSDCQYLIIIIMKVALALLVCNKTVFAYWLIHFLNH